MEGGVMEGKGKIIKVGLKILKDSLMIGNTKIHISNKKGSWIYLIVENPDLLEVFRVKEIHEDKRRQRQKTIERRNEEKSGNY